MRYHVLRFDIWVCLSLGVVLAFGVHKLTTPYLELKYEDYKNSKKVNVGEIGGIASDDIFRATSIEDIFLHDSFTVVSPGIEYKNRGAGFYKNFYLFALTLPSGEIVAARINTENVKVEKTETFKDNSILPVGRIVMEDLSSNSYFLAQIESNYRLSRTDFYIDMVGESEVIDKDSFLNVPILLLQLGILLFTFPIFHMIGSKLGIFPYFFEPKVK